MPRDAFLDVVGARGAPVRPAPARAGRSGGGVAGFGPLAVTLAFLAGVAASGLSRRMDLPEALEPYAYGFFTDRYPLFAFALVYGAARIVAVAAQAGRAGAVRRTVFALAGIGALFLVGLYPTFGGLILRAAFATGGMAFLTSQPLWLAYALGAGVAAAMVGGLVGAFGIAANRPLRPSLRRIGWGALSFLGLWFGAAVIGLGRAFGVGPWPARAMTPGEAGLAAILLIVATLPHSLLVASRARRGGD